MSGIAVPYDEIYARRSALAEGRVPRSTLALEFPETEASSVEVLVEGKAFYPRMARGHRLGDVVDPH